MTTSSMAKQQFVKGAKAANSFILLGYDVVSNGVKQMNAPGAKALKIAGRSRILEGSAMGGLLERTDLHRMPEQPREGGAVVFLKLDRLPRLLKDVLCIMGRIVEVDVGVRYLLENSNSKLPKSRR